MKPKPPAKWGTLYLSIKESTNFGLMSIELGWSKPNGLIRIGNQKSRMTLQIKPPMKPKRFIPSPENSTNTMPKFPVNTAVPRMSSGRVGLQPVGGSTVASSTAKPATEFKLLSPAA